MRRGGRILIILGIVLALITAVVTFLILQSPGGTTKIVTAPVVVAFQHIAERTDIPADAIGVQQWPAETVPPDALADIADAVGKMTLVPIFPGQAILKPMIVDKKAIKPTGSNASFLLPEGKVAVAFPLTLVSGVAGAIQEGDTVDIMITMSLPGEGEAAAGETTGAAVTQLILQDVLVLKVGTWGPLAGKQGQETANVLTFLMDRQDALVLKYARENTVAVDLALRPAGDHDIVETEPVSQQYMQRRFNLSIPAGR